MRYFREHPEEIQSNARAFSKEQLDFIENDRKRYSVVKKGINQADTIVENDLRKDEADELCTNFNMFHNQGGSWYVVLEDINY